jgi:hypothetical protein
MCAQTRYGIVRCWCTAHTQSRVPCGYGKLMCFTRRPHERHGIDEHTLSTRTLRAWRSSLAMPNVGAGVSFGSSNSDMYCATPPIFDGYRLRETRCGGCGESARATRAKAWWSRLPACLHRIRRLHFNAAEVSVTRLSLWCLLTWTAN